VFLILIVGGIYLTMVDLEIGGTAKYYNAETSSWIYKFRKVFILWGNDCFKSAQIHCFYLYLTRIFESEYRSAISVK
jgi:hypothetical protein